MPFFRPFIIALALLSGLFGICASAQPVDGGHARVELVSERTAAMPGETVWFGLSFELDDGWHIYWKNAGDAGIPPSINWADETTVPPENINAFLWPTPELLPVVPGEIMDYGYSDRIVLPFAVRIPQDADQPIVFKGIADYLICETICIPESVPIQLRLAVGDEPFSDAYGGGLISEAIGQVPPAFEGEASLTEQGNVWTLSLRGGQLAATRAPARLFPAGHEIVHAAEQTVRYGPEGLQIDLVPDDAFPGALAGTLVAGDIAVDITAQAGPVLPGTQGTGFGPPVNLPLLVGLALIGGLILNLMPCVLPVLSIKAFGIVTASAQGGQGEARAHGLWYTAGVLATFAALAVAIVSVRAATGISTWGFWLQSAPVVTALILIVFLIGLWLLGMFELGSSVQNVGSGLAARQGSAGAFFTGVLAAIVGAPCTGPFLGAALGAIMGRPAIEVFIVLIAMGLGMALPFLLISFVPSLHRRLPKPGVWMDTLKQVFAFPMFLTAAWLLSVLGALAGFRAAAMVVAGAVLIGFGIWVIRSAETGGRAILIAVAGLVSIIPIFWLMGALSADSITLAPLIQGLAGLLILVGAIYLFAKLPAIRTGQVAKLLGAAAIIVGLSWPMFGMRPAVATDAAVSSYSYAVEAWSDARVAELQAEGRPIFVDFTAEWCATCQANKLQALRTGPVTEAFLAANVAFLEADFTRPDAAISAALKQHNRAGVPLYLWYAPGETEPQILPEILSVDLVTNLVAQIG